MCAAVEPGWGNGSPLVLCPIRQSPFPLSGVDGDGIRWRGGGRPPAHREDADGHTTVWFGAPPAAETVSHTTLRMTVCTVSALPHHHHRRADRR